MFNFVFILISGTVNLVISNRWICVGWLSSQLSECHLMEVEIPNHFTIVQGEINVTSIWFVWLVTIEKFPFLGTNDSKNCESFLCKSVKTFCMA